MRKILVSICTIISIMCNTAFACESNEIDVLGDGTQCETAKFMLTTTELVLPTDSEFRFTMTAIGTFYVDCGNDGTLSGTGVSDKTITRTNTTETLYTCTYNSGGEKQIRISGRATGYAQACGYNSWCAAIRFGYPYGSGNTGTTYKLVAAVDGSLGAIFPTLGQSDTMQPVFPSTFQSCPNLTRISENLFDGVYGCEKFMFFQTFISSSVQEIPENLFGGINCIKSNTFRSTFWNTKITSLPENLFANITEFASNPEEAFFHTFYGCTNLTGYIPPSLFAGLIKNGSPIATNMWTGAFKNNNLATTCPAGTVQFITGYEDYWDGHVSCVDENLVCDSGKYLPQHWYQCEKCPENNYCGGGTYAFNETISQGITSCPNNWYSPMGMSSVDQCGRILHIGDNVVYLRSVKKTSPALHVKVEDTIFYGNMTTSDVVMNSNTDKKLKLQYDGQTYSVYDDTVVP